MVEARCEFKYYVTEGEIRVELEGLEVKKLLFNAANFSKALHARIIAAEPEVFLHVKDENQRAEIYLKL